MEIDCKVQNFHCFRAKPVGFMRVFLKNPKYAPPTKQNPSSLPENPAKPTILRRDHNSGNQGHLQAVSAKKPCEICANKSDCQKPANLTGFIPFKTLVFRKYAF